MTYFRLQGKSDKILGTLRGQCPFFVVEIAFLRKSRTGAEARSRGAARGNEVA